MPYTTCTGGAPLPPLPLQDGEAPRTFTAPWQAQVFALAVDLNARGAFTWAEWAAVFGRELHAPDAADDASDYYARWLRALVDLLVSKGITSRAEIEALTEAWQRAAHATPHGQPILLANDPGA